MEKAKLSRLEQETHIDWDAENNIAYIDSVNPSVVRKLEKLHAEFPEVYKLIRRDKVYGGITLQVPKKYIRFGKPASEQKVEAARQRANKRFRKDDSPKDISDEEDAEVMDEE